MIPDGGEIQEGLCTMVVVVMLYEQGGGGSS